MYGSIQRENAGVGSVVWAECKTFNQLALGRPNRTNTVFLRGPKNRESLKQFWHKKSVNNPHTHTGVKPYARENGSKLERALGTSHSCGFKV